MFQDLFHQEGNIEAFNRAIEDTITALNTGCLRARDGTILQQANGKAYITNHDWRAKLDTIVDILGAIRSRYDLALKQGTLHLGHNDGRQQWYCMNDHTLAVWMDETRPQAIDIIANLCTEAGVHPPHVPRHHAGKERRFTEERLCIELSRPHQDRRRRNFAGFFPVIRRPRALFGEIAAGKKLIRTPGGYGSGARKLSVQFLGLDRKVRCTLAFREALATPESSIFATSLLHSALAFGTLRSGCVQLFPQVLASSVGFIFSHYLCTSLGSVDDGLAIR